MRRSWSSLVAIICLCGLSAGLAVAQDAAEVRRLTSQAEAMLWFGLAENGRIEEFSKALERLDRADELLAAAQLPEPDRIGLTRQIEVLREDLTLNLARSRKRFLGTFPLARLIVPLPMMSAENDLTETVLRDSANEAVRTTAQRVVDDIVRWDYPHVVFRSMPHNRAFEIEAMRVFAGARRPFANSRATLAGVLTPQELGAYDRGDSDPDTAARLMESLGAVKLLIVTIRQDVELPDGIQVVLEGKFFERGAVGPTGSFAHMGFSRSREDQLPWMVLGQFVLFAVALVVAGNTEWSAITPWPVPQRIAMGAGLFVVGRIFAPVAVMLLQSIVPTPDAATASSAWWPALVGAVVILGSGFVAWLAQARLARIVVGSRTSRAVGTIYSLAALGGCAYFFEPVLMLDPGAGILVLVPLVLAAVLVGGLTGYAIRTGPPVPPYFLLGAFIVATAVGIALLAMSPRLLWATVASSVVLIALAIARYKYAVARGLEEAEPDEEAAEQADLEHLEKLGKDFEKKLPI